jgi:hypothetical protein
VTEKTVEQVADLYQCTITALDAKPFRGNIKASGICNFQLRLFWRKSLAAIDALFRFYLSHPLGSEKYVMVIL